jgi:hypothetical protein
MPNRTPKGIERMRQLGRRGGKKSGEARRLNALELRLIRMASLREITGCTWEEVLEAVRPPDLSSGNHDTDWRCPTCHHFNSIKHWVCAKCFRMASRNGRLTRAALRIREAEHRTQAILAKHGI